MKSDWSDWIGRETVHSDTLDPALARRWLATLDRDIRPDGIMPEAIHFCLCTPEASTVSLGEDGHPARDNSAAGFFPPIPLPRRMWAASEINFLAPIKIGARIQRVSRIASILEKDGKSGRLGFVVVEHITSADDVQAIREVQTLVYREAAAPDAPLSPSASGSEQFNGSDWDIVRTVKPDERMLFRFSALTFNSHRIHYDLPYARNVERYRGLVVHGPLIATLLTGLITDSYGAGWVETLSFRAVSPAIAGEPLNLVMRGDGTGLELGAFAGDGRQTLTATACLR